jgi:PAS domain S-box-containing protein
MALKPAGMVAEKNIGWVEDFVAGFPLALFRESLDGQIVYCNEAFAEMFGFKGSTELVDLSITHFYGNLQDRRTLVEAVIRHGRVRDVLMPFRRRDRSTIWCSVTEQVVLDRRGHPVCLDGFLKEVGGKGAKKKIKLQEEQLLKEKFLGILEMAGGVAHTLNQPLTVIRNTATEVLSLLSPEDPLYDKVMRMHLQIERIHEAVMKIGNIKRYEAMDYVAGIRIVDIDKTS